MQDRAPPTKWRTQIIPVDIETGEIIDREAITQGEYIVVKKKCQTIQQGESYAIRVIEYHCRRNPQEYLEL